MLPRRFKPQEPVAKPDPDMSLFAAREAISVPAEADLDLASVEEPIDEQRLKEDLNNENSTYG